MSLEYRREESIDGDLVALLKHCASMTNYIELDFFIKNDLQKWIPHKMAMWGIVDTDRSQFINLSNIDFPNELLDSMTKRDATNIFMDCPALSQWTKTLETIEVSKKKLTDNQIGVNIYQLGKYFDADNIESVIIAGLPDLAGNRATLFCFASEKKQLSPLLKKSLDLVIPYLHQVVVRQYAREHVSHKNKTAKILTPRETQMLEFIYKGFEYQDIADSVGISVNTVRSHFQNIFKKFHVSNRTQALVKAIDLGIISVP